MKAHHLIVIVILFLGCDEIRPSINHHLSSDKKYLFNEGDVLSYQSDTQTEQFEVIKIVNGKYEDSRSGTCAKPRLEIYEYQAVYLKSVDSLSRTFRFVPTLTTDCDGFPFFTARELICSFNTSYSEKNHDKIIWMNEFAQLIFGYYVLHKSLTLRNQVYKNVFEFEVPGGKRISKIYYTRRMGFVGYELTNGSVFTLTK